jgi:hypothetical protein
MEEEEKKAVYQTQNFGGGEGSVPNTKFWRWRRQCETLAGNAHLFIYAPF